MRHATLLFPVRPSKEPFLEICLAIKKRGFGAGRWNGAGGKVHPGEAIESALIRETKEELDITVLTFTKVAELTFTFPHEPTFNQLVHTYLTDSWEGEPHESEEMRPRWFSVADIPYGEMWPDDILWLPQVLEGKKLRGAFTFAPGDLVTEHQVEIVSKF